MPHRSLSLPVLCVVAALAWAVLTNTAAHADDGIDGFVRPAPNYGYSTRMEEAPKGTEKELLALTETEKQKDNPPPTLFLLKRRMDNDAETLVKALHAKGFYDARIVTAIDKEEEGEYIARFTIIPGEVYTLQSARFILSPQSETKDIELPPIENLGLPLGGEVDYTQILDARSTLRNRIHAMNCLHRVRIRVHLRVDTTRKAAEAVYRITTGKTANFGTMTINGLTSVEQPYIDRKIPWKQGDCFRPTMVEDLQVTLLQTNLFSKSDVTLPEEPNKDGEVDIVLDVHERKHRTIKAGIGFATELGLDFKPAWEHRNFFGQGERVTVDGTISTFLQSLKTRFERQDFMRRDQKLVLEAEISQFDGDAYDSTSLRTLAQLSRPIGPNLTGGLGVAYALKQVDDGGTNSGQETFSLVSFPGYVQHNTRNSEVDPTKGHLLRIDAEPFIETLNTGDVFFKTQGTASWYHQHETVPLKPTWAFRAKLGSIMGSANNDIPADERFYSGGGGSVRGYGFQMLGPLQNGSPTGGRSLVEFSAELRLRVTDSIGLVPFVDAGNVYPDIYPEFNGDLFYAAGLGFRYFTDFGPFRFDVATPLDKRAGIDDDYQLYISFGQAF